MPVLSAVRRVVHRWLSSALPVRGSLLAKLGSIIICPNPAPSPLQARLRRSRRGIRDIEASGVSDTLRVGYKTNGGSPSRSVKIAAKMRLQLTSKMLPNICNVYCQINAPSHFTKPIILHTSIIFMKCCNNNEKHANKQYNYPYMYFA